MTETRKKGTIARRWMAGLAIPCVIAAGCMRAELKPPPGEVAVFEGRFGGNLVVDNTLSLPLSGAVVTTEKEKAVADRDGRFSFANLSPGKHLVVAEKRFDSGPVRRLLGVAKIFVEKGPVPIRIAMKDASDVDSFCLDCHPPMNRVTRGDQIMRDIHPSGIVPRKARKPTGKFDERGRVTCESCHSVHKSTGFPHFALVSYTDGKMCVQCH